MLINVLFPDDKEKVGEYVAAVKYRNERLPIPLWQLKIDQRPVSGGRLVCFRVSHNMPIGYVLLLGTIACAVVSILIWRWAYIGCIVFFVLSLFLSESFFYFGIKKGWRTLSKEKLRKLTSRQTLGLLLKTREVWRK